MLGVRAFDFCMVLSLQYRHHLLELNVEVRKILGQAGAVGSGREGRIHIAVDMASYFVSKKTRQRRFMRHLSRLSSVEAVRADRQFYGDFKKNRWGQRWRALPEQGGIITVQL